MTTYLFLGDLLVMGLVTGLAIWLLLYADKEELDQVSRIPLDDDRDPPSSLSR